MWLEIRARPLASGSGHVLAMSDISLRKRAEEELAIVMKRLEGLASTDPLTALSSRRAFDEALSKEFAGCAAAGAPLSLLLIDVDRFKSFNDGYGHLAGDDCLRQLGQVLTVVCGARGFPARYGGEELVAILPHTEAIGAAATADEVRVAVRALRLPHAASEFGIVTVSIGVATLLPDATTNSARDLIQKADEALYAAKNGGRDQVMTSLAA